MGTLLVHAARIGEAWHRHGTDTGMTTPATDAALCAGLVVGALVFVVVAWTDARETRAARKEFQG